MSRLPPSRSTRNSAAGDVRHSQADISKARRLIGYDPAYRVADGIAEAMPWYRDFLRAG